MKHIKRFNEELKSSTYNSAAYKIKALGKDKKNKQIYDDRFVKLRDKAESINIIENRSAWQEKMIEFKGNTIVNGVLISDRNDNEVEGRFYIYIDINADAIIEMNDIEQDNFEMEFSFYPGFIPADEETYNNCMETLGGMFNNGMAEYTLLGGVYVSLSNGGFSNLHINYHEHSGGFRFNDISGYRGFKNAITKAFIREKDEINKVIIQTGIGSDYGLDYKDIYDYLKKLNVNDLIK